ncbi:hypothetical protein GCK72_021463 [Caenorhabditis remanei]|uniref:F-box domain-containing protein n=1 Tax=Caenorhabditis remanei TaxID=31234 RepID=A0A6A5GI81_CAERE|nr:hypothetical protein GCK72_021463 [Caenorhabditis remanei]KAF1754898.1 hypothetical protein GCK72_021463 [Caenorhabditis remanei]
MTSKTLLVDFPAIIKSKVLENLDVFSILKLRKVYNNLRQFIDKNPPKPNWNVTVSTCSDFISIEFASPKWLNISFKQYENICIMSWRNDHVCKSLQFQDESYIDVFSRELGLIMKHHSTGVLKSFLINQYEEKDGEQVLEQLTKIGCVSTDEVVLENCTLDQFAEYFPFFNSNHLYKIRIKDDFEQEKKDQENDFRMLNLQEIRQLDQWKNSKHVKVEVNDFHVRIQDFLHFEKVEIECKMMPVQDCILLKENFLTSSTLTSFDIQIDDDFDDRRQLYASFGLPSLPVDEDEKWFFRIPENRKVLSVTLTEADEFLFRKIDIQDVPKGAEIKN